MKNKAAFPVIIFIIILLFCSTVYAAPNKRREALKPAAGLDVSEDAAQGEDTETENGPELSENETELSENGTEPSENGTELPEDAEASQEIAFLPAPVIKSVHLTRIAEARYSAYWVLENAENVNVRVYASQSKRNPEGILLGSCESGENGSLFFTMPDMDSGYYFAYITVTGPDGTTVTSAADSRFFFDNPERDAAPLGLSVSINGRSIFVFKEDNTPVIIDLYTRSTGEFFRREYVDSYPYEIVLNKDASLYELLALGGSRTRPGKAAYIENSAQPDSYRVIGKTDGITGKPAFEFSVDERFAELPLRIYNGMEEIKAEPLDDGKFWILLNEGENVLTFVVSGADGKLYTERQTVILDTKAPVVFLENGFDTVSTEKQVIVLKGTMDEGAHISCGDAYVETAGGCFIIEKELAYGSNEVEILAEDNAGNRTVMQVNVERTLVSGTLQKIIVTGAVAAAAIIIEATLLSAGVRRKK